MRKRGLSQFFVSAYALTVLALKSVIYGVNIKQILNLFFDYTIRTLQFLQAT